MNEEDFQQQLEEQLNARVPNTSRARHLTLLVLALTGVAIYAGWRIKNPEVKLAPEKAVNAANFNLRTLKNRSDTFLPAETPAAEKLPELRPLPSLPQIPEPAPLTKSAADTSAALDDVSAMTPASPAPRTLGGTRPAGDVKALAATEEVVLPADDGENFTPAPLTATDTNLKDFVATATTDGLHPPVPVTAVSAPRYHQVGAEESLPEIAARYYGSDDVAHIIRIRDANPCLKTGGFRAGIRLLIPDGAPRVSPPAPAVSAGRATLPAQTPVSSGTYTVVPGDTLSRIAAKLYGRPAAWKEIYALNRDRLSSPDALRNGMRLRLPR